MCFPKISRKNLTQQHFKALLFLVIKGEYLKLQKKSLGTAGLNCPSFISSNSTKTVSVLKESSTNLLLESWCNTIVFLKQRYKLSKQI